MPEHIDDFSPPWAQHLLNSPEYRPIPMTNRLPLARFNSMGSNRAFTLTLNTPRSIRAYQLIYRPPNPDASPPNGLEMLSMVSIGNGLDSWDGILGRGILCLLVDNVSAILASISFLGRVVVTTELKTMFKKSMKMPGLALYRARIEKKEGRKLWVRGTVEDGMGSVHIEAEAVFWDPGVKEKAKLQE